MVKYINCVQWQLRGKNRNKRIYANFIFIVLAKLWQWVCGWRWCTVINQVGNCRVVVAAKYEKLRLEPPMIPNAWFLAPTLIFEYRFFISIESTNQLNSIYFCTQLATFRSISNLLFVLCLLIRNEYVTIMTYDCMHVKLINKHVNCHKYVTWFIGIPSNNNHHHQQQQNINYSCFIGNNCFVILSHAV